VSGVTVEADGQRFDVRAGAVVNAAGVWTDDVRALDEGANPRSIRPAKGVHITVPWSKVQNDIAAVVPVPKDRRSVFVVPWSSGPGGERFTYIGTTDTDYDGPVDDPRCTPDDVEYLLRAINFSVTTTITEDDIVGTWAGLRPLVRGESNDRTADLSRRHAVLRSPSGVITITGGKLTTYRRMAADTVDAVVETLGDSVRAGRSRTKAIALRGADGWEAVADEHLAGRYGGEARTLQAMIDADPTMGEPLVPGLPYLRAEGRYAARYEMARSLDDVLSRRTRARLLARDATAAVAEQVAALVGPDLGWDDAEQARQVQAYRSGVAAERESAGLPELVAGLSELSEL
jgi:glycerol-3-phosphate dehydrogenase